MFKFVFPVVLGLFVALVLGLVTVPAVQGAGANTFILTGRCRDNQQQTLAGVTCNVQISVIYADGSNWTSAIVPCTSTETGLYQTAFVWPDKGAGNPAVNVLTTPNQTFTKTGYTYANGGNGFWNVPPGTGTAPDVIMNRNP